MKKNSHIICPSLMLLFSLLIFSNCVSTTGGSSSTLETLSDRIPVHEITFPTPKDNEALTYLGLPSEESFKIPQIKADVVLINVFSTTCPHCKKEAPNTNKLYETIEDRPDLKGRIKIIGIGARDTLEKIASFKEENKVPFPLFSDKDMSIFEQLGASATPTLIGIKTIQGASPVFLFSKAGSIGDVDWFIDFLLDVARLENGLGK